jgi:hypothetical protein
MMPSDFMELSRRERAFITAAAQIRAKKMKNGKK